jgi:hypothetical protein
MFALFKGYYYRKRKRKGTNMKLKNTKQERIYDLAQCCGLLNLPFRFPLVDFPHGVS